MSNEIMGPLGSESEKDTIPYGTPDEDDRGTLCDGTQSLGIEYNYVPDWRAPHVIREYHQNGKDGIKQASQLSNRDFIIVDKKDQYIIETRHPDKNALLGFILWNDDGAIQYSNFGAQLSRKALNFGVSTKSEHDDLAGAHGEGVKVSSLVMIRRGYRVRYEASQFYSNFQLGGREGGLLCSKLSRMGGKKLGKQMDEYKTKAGRGFARALKASIWKDVTVTIGRDAAVPTQNLVSPTWSENYENYENFYDGSDEDENESNFNLDDFSGKSSTHGIESDVSRLSGALWPSPPKSRSRPGNSISQPECWYKQQSKQFLDQVETQLKLLALKETELDEAKTELTIQSEALDVATKALRNNRLWLEQSVAKVEETQSLLEKLNKKVHRMEPQHRVASNGNHADSAMQTETFLNQVQQLKEQNERLTIHLKEAEKEVKEAWSIIARSPREETSGDAAKRKRVKGEQVDNESDTLRPFAAAVKRARQERIDQVLEEVHHLIPVVLEGRR